MTEPQLAVDLHGVCSRLYAAASAGDEEAWLGCFRPDAELLWPGMARPARGHEQLREVFCAFRASTPSVALHVVAVEVDDFYARVIWAGTGVSWDGRPAVLEGTDQVESGPDGLIRTLVSEWKTPAG